VPSVRAPLLYLVFHLLRFSVLHSFDVAPLTLDDALLNLSSIRIRNSCDPWSWARAVKPLSERSRMLFLCDLMALVFDFQYRWRRGLWPIHSVDKVRIRHVV
jgi:hypothetical protein